MTAALVIGLIALCVICIAANETRKRGVRQRNADDFLDQTAGDWPDLSSFKSFGGVADFHRSGDTK